MDELEPKRLPIDVESEVGMTRRDLLRRSAIVGGALLWAAPTIQTVGMKAAAAYGPSPGTCSACYCYTVGGDGKVSADWGVVDTFLPGTGQVTADDCENWCKHQASYAGGGGAPGGPYQNHSYCSGTPTGPTDQCRVNTLVGQDPPSGGSPNPVCP